MDKQHWISKIKEWKEKWPVFQEQGDKLNDDLNGINLYKFYEILGQNLKEDSVVVWDAGSVLYCSNQSLRLNGQNQRSIGSLAQAEMGAAIGIACGVCFARNKKEVLVTTGDGSLNTQIHSLAIVKKHNLPLKIFILQNFGFLSIKNSQDKFYEGRRIGTSEKDGYFFPKIVNIAKTYEIGYLKVNKISNLDYVIKQAMNLNEPVIVEIICQEIQEISPGITAKKTPEGKYEQCDFSNVVPFLSQEQYNKEMIKE